MTDETLPPHAILQALMCPLESLACMLMNFDVSKTLRERLAFASCPCRLLPHANTWPQHVSSIVCCVPQATCRTRGNAHTKSVACWYCCTRAGPETSLAALLRPSCPDWLSPHEKRTPSGVTARVLAEHVSTYEKIGRCARFPVWTSLKYSRDNCLVQILHGSSVQCGVLLHSPSCCFWFSPVHHSSPLQLAANVVPSPHDKIRGIRIDCAMPVG